MKRIFLFLIFIICFTNQVNAKAPTNYKIVWEDNFDGKFLNLKNWKTSLELRDNAQQTDTTKLE